MYRMISRSGLLCLAVLLAACGEKTPENASFRAAGKGIYSNAVLQTDRLEGNWFQIADFATSEARCGAGRLDISEASASQMTVAADLCLDGRKERFSGIAKVSGPGRITLTGADTEGLGSEWWVLWADDGYRTLVIGTPSGSFGMILNRDAELPADRLKAAREILDWNGYDLARLRMLPAG